MLELPDTTMVHEVLQIAMCRLQCVYACVTFGAVGEGD